jgi:mycothiol synthase
MNQVEPPKGPELQMVWSNWRLTQPPAWIMPEGYALRIYQPGDEVEFFELMDRAGFQGWNMHKFQTWLMKILPDGFFFAIHTESGKMAATAMACHNPTLLHPSGATLEWVATDSLHQGKGLGYAVSAAVTCRLLHAGYKEIYLETDAWRLAAIKIYLKMGWVPFLFRGDMPERWKAICETLGWLYTPEVWRTV